MKKKIFIRKQFLSHCSYSGYDRLFEYLNKKIVDAENIVDRQVKRFWFPRSLYTYLKRKYWIGTLFYNSSSSMVTELQAFWKARRTKASLLHFGYFEDHYGFFRSARIRQKLRGCKVVATVHCPSSWWKLYCNPNMVKTLDGLIVLSNNEVDFFNTYLPGKVFCVPHGVDTDFFKPPTEKKENSSFRCIFVGQWLRDIETLVYVIEKLLLQKKDIVFDIFYPEWKRHNRDYLYRIINNPNVVFHGHVSDNELRDNYQKADILVLPLFDCTANNAVLEGMASGLPVVSNDVPGIHTYVNDSFSSLTNVADVDGMVDDILHYYDNPELVQKHSALAREHALNNFTWDNIANQVIQTYDRILN